MSPRLLIYWVVNPPYAKSQHKHSRKIANGNSTVAKQEIRMGWHLFDIDLIFGGIALLLLASTDIFDTPHTIAHLIGLYYAGYSIIIITSTLGIPSRDRVIRLPQWILTGVIAGLTLYGATIL